MAAAGWFTLLVNCRLCVDGELRTDQIVFSEETGKILKRTGGDAIVHAFQITSN
jgi:hypothetical protein